MTTRKLLAFLTFTAVSLAGTTVSAQVDSTKKNAQSAAAAAAAAFVNAPETKVEPPKPKYWKQYLVTNVKFDQQMLSSWAAGGVNTVSLATYIDGNANYAKNKVFWNNRLQIDYGFLYQDDKPFLQKKADRIYFESKFGRKATDKLNFSSEFTLVSQLTNSYNYHTPKDFEGDKPSRQDWMDARALKSGFFSPARLTVGFGIDWVPNPKNKWLVVNFAPLTGGLTLVTDESLRFSNGMARKKAYRNEEEFPYDIKDEEGKVTGYHGEYFRPAKFQLGSKLTLDLKVMVNNNIKYASQLVLFSDYLDNPQNLRVNWDNRLDWNFAKYFAITLSTFLIYDDNVLIKDDKDIEKYPNGRRRVQFKEALEVGFKYTFQPKK